MLVSLKVDPISHVGMEDATELVLRFSVLDAQGTLRISRDVLERASRTLQPIIVRLTEPEGAIPDAKRIKRITAKQEVRVAQALGGQRQRGSGAVPWNKGDGRVRGKYRIENKTRFTKGITITREDLAKIRSECAPGEVPLFQVDFTDRITGRVQDQWILIPFDHWETTVRAASNNR